MMTRKEIYAKIKEYELQEKIKNVYGLDYTHICNEDLQAIVDDYEDNLDDNSQTLLEEQFDTLISILSKKHILLPSEINQIYK